MITLYPFRLDMEKGRITAAFPGECEPACRAVNPRNTLRLARTRDERQCRGCGRWGIFSPRAITAGGR